MYIYIYVFLIAANRHGNLLILIFLDERSPEERETFRFRFEGYSIIDGNVRENLHTIKDYSANNRGYIYIYIYIYTHHPWKKREDRSAACFIARCNNCMQMGAQVERQVR